MRKVFVFICFLYPFFLEAQQGWDNLAFRKSFHDQLDDCLFKYERFGKLDTEIRQERFLDLFTDSARIQDFINPIVDKKRVTYLKKPAQSFVSEFTQDFPAGFIEFEITDIDYDKLGVREIDLTRRSFDLMITQETRAEKSTGDFFESSPELQLKIVFDTSRNEVINLRINKIIIQQANLKLEQKVTERQVRQSYEIGASVAIPFNKITGKSSIKTPGSASLIVTDGESGSIQLNNKEVVSIGGSFIFVTQNRRRKELAWSFGGYFERARFGLELDTFQSVFDDVENTEEREPFIRIVEGTNIEEDVFVYALRFPFRVRGEREISDFGMGVFVHLGADILFRANTTFIRNNGSIQHSGFYPQYGNFILTDVPELGFGIDNSQGNQSTYVLRNFDLPLSLSTGLSIPLKKGSAWFLYMALGLNWGIIDAANFNESHLPSRELGQYDGSAPWLEEIKFRSLSLTFFLRRKFKIKVNEL